MNEVLPVALRPKRFSGLYGQDKLVASIRSRMAKRPPRSWMLIGSPGTGKTTIARIMAIAFNCDHQNTAEWGNPCDECWKASFEIHEVNAAEVSGKEELSGVARTANVKPLIGTKRVIILDEFHEVSKAAQNLLLKPFEEPSPSTVWIICTSDPAKVLPALKRRMATYIVKGLGFETRERFVKKIAAKHGITRPLAPFIEQLNVMGISSPGIILKSLESFGSGMEPAQAILDMGETKVEPIRMCRLLVAGKWLDLRKELKLLEPEDTRGVQAMISSYLKSMLLGEGDPRKQEKIATSMLELNPLTYQLDDRLLYYWIIPTLHRICKRFR